MFANRHTYPNSNNNNKIKTPMAQLHQYLGETGPIKLFLSFFFFFFLNIKDNKN